MTDFAQLLDHLKTLDPVLIGLGLIGLLLLVLLFRRPKDQAGPLRDALAAKELELRDAQTGAGRAEEIAKRAGLLYDKVAGFVSSMEGVGTRLRQAQDSYDAALGQLSQGGGNVLRQVEMLKTLGARTTKSIGMEFDGTDEASAPESGDVVMLEKAQEGVFAT